ncbi:MULTISPECIES: deaminase domain-containing protein [Brevibacillus]|uniref:deaminase domain-containing protein n=1 Tax=Brevibacillus TaxID=55080 RepID=UPI001E3135D3|nr:MULTISPECIES: deaminase domain-containing protein [Brevibacillus]MED1948092.1 deaminase domain-containing protein [Brevibacillus formosus]MED1998177.1 deaminase domain-containing protein [Brevibacillus formosus]MED2080718.1 deaminase domain-containing protein [Brevibacillus formosus]
MKVAKKKLPKWARKAYNFGYAKVEIKGLEDKTEYFAHSAIENPKQIKDEADREKIKDISVEPPEGERLFKTQKVNKQNVVNGEEAWDRATDTEFKILNEIATKLGENKEAVGKIKMYTDLDCCPSCSNVIGQFKEKYPKIEIEVIYKTKGGGT